MKTILITLLCFSFLKSDVLELSLRNFIINLSTQYNKTVLIDKALDQNMIIASGDLQLNFYSSLKMIKQILRSKDLVIEDKGGYYYISTAPQKSKLININLLDKDLLSRSAKKYDLEIEYLESNLYLIYYKDHNDLKSFLDLADEFLISKTLKIEGEIYRINHNELKEREININALVNTINDFENSFKMNLDLFESLEFDYSSGSSSISAFLNFLDTKGLIDIVTRPNFITQSGKPANFYNGYEFRQPQTKVTNLSDDNPLSEITYKDVKTGLNIKIKATKLNKLVLIDLLFEDSSINNIDENLNYIKQNTTYNATFPIPIGKSIAIAGLTSDKTTVTNKKVPILGDIPIIKYPFNYDNKSSEKTTYIINLKVSTLDIIKNKIQRITNEK